MRRLKRIIFVFVGVPVLVAGMGVWLCWSVYEKWLPFRGWHYIVIHHSASPSGSAASFDRYHLERGIPGGLAYHFVIGNGRGAKDGSVEAGHRWKKCQTGGHVSINAWNYDVFGIGICLVGNFEKARPTPLQWRSLVETIANLCRKYGIDPANILGHTEVPWYWRKNQTELTACPGRFLDIKALRREVRQRLSVATGSQEKFLKHPKCDECAKQGRHIFQSEQWTIETRLSFVIKIPSKD